MIKLFTKQQKYDIENGLVITQYRKDLEAFTVLRDKIRDNNEERDRYTVIIEIMQKVVERLLDE